LHLDSIPARSSRSCNFPGAIGVVAVDARVTATGTGLAHLTSPNGVLLAGSFSTVSQVGLSDRSLISFSAVPASLALPRSPRRR
jgi:hypothetical protein